MAQVQFRMLNNKSSESLQGYLVFAALKAKILSRALLQLGFSLQELSQFQAANHTSICTCSSPKTYEKKQARAV